MKVTLINYTQNPEKLVAIAARMCYSPLSATEMVENLDGETVGNMVMKMKETHHDSLIEHINFTFIIEGVSRVLSHQLVRHRIASYHQRSQRYVKKAMVEECIIPPSIIENREALSAFERALDKIDEAYEEMIKLGIPKEDARYIYPNATGTQLILTMNGRSLIHMLGLRCCNRAQWEIRHMANLILVELRKVSPLLFNSVGPNCYINHGKCPEGKMTCGKSNKVCSDYLPANFNNFMEVQYGTESKY